MRAYVHSKCKEAKPYARLSLRHRERRHTIVVFLGDLIRLELDSRETQNQPQIGTKPTLKPTTNWHKANHKAYRESRTHNPTQIQMKGHIAKIKTQCSLGMCKANVDFKPVHTQASTYRYIRLHIWSTCLFPAAPFWSTWKQWDSSRSLPTCHLGIIWNLHLACKYRLLKSNIMEETYKILRKGIFKTLFPMQEFE